MTRADELYRRANALQVVADLVACIETAEPPCKEHYLPCAECPANTPEGCFFTSLRSQAEELCKHLCNPAGRPGPDRKRPDPIIEVD